MVRIPAVPTRSLWATGRPCRTPTGPPTSEELVGAGGVGHRPLGDERDNGIDLRIDALDVRQVRSHYLASGDLFGADPRVRARSR